MMPLKDRIAVVTGAARGIGLAVARLLAADGARVAALDVDGAVLDEALPQATWRIALDVTDPAAVARLPAVLDGPAAIVVHCAGITADAMVHKMTPEQYRRVLDVNLAGSHRVSAALIPGMRAARFGRIVYIGSRAWLGNVGQANYAASKGGLVGLARAQALSLGRDGIRVNVVAPGLIETRLTDAIPDRIRDRLVAAIPLGRIGQPADIAHVVRFLVDPASDFITGQTLLVCGGRSVGAPIVG